MTLCDKTEALSDFLTALDEWGCEDNYERAQEIIEFMAGGADLSQYLEKPRLHVVPPTEREET